MKRFSVALRRISVLLLILAFAVPVNVFAAYLASQVVGQTDTSGNGFFTKGGVNDGPNNKGFNLPNGACIDPVNHRLFVPDHVNNRVLVFNLNANHTFPDRTADFVLGQPDFLSNTAAITQSGMTKPRGCVFDQANERLFVILDNTGAADRVMIYNLSSGITNGMNASWVLGQSGFTAADNVANTQVGVHLPLDVDYDPINERLFVAEFLGNRVKVWDLSSGITNGASASFVLGQSDFTSSGAANTQTGMSQPAGINYDATNERLFVAEFGGNRAKVFDLSGGISNGMSAHIILGQTSWTGATTGTTATTMDGPVGVDYASASQQLFMTDRDNSRVLVFNANPAVLASSAAAINVLGQDDFTTKTSGLTAGKFGTLLTHSLYDPTSDVLYVEDLDQNRLMVFDVSTITDGEGAVDALGQIDANGDPIFTQGGVNNGPNRTGLNFPALFFMDTTENRLFAGDPGNNRVLVFNLDSNNNPIDTVADFVIGQPDFSTGTASTGAAFMDNPQAITYDSENMRLFVAEYDNHRVLVFDLSSGITNGMAASWVLGQPNFASSSANATITVNGCTTTPNACGFDRPFGLFYDSEEDRLFASDQLNERVLVFDLSSGITNGMAASWVLGQPDLTTQGANLSQTGMGSARGISYDAARKRLFVISQNQNRVMAYDLSSGITNGASASFVLGQPDFTTSSTNTQNVGNGCTTTPNACGLNNPTDIRYYSTMDALFVTDFVNNRVLLFNVDPDVVSNGDAAIAVLGQDNFTTGSSGASQQKMNGPIGVSLDTTNNTLWVAEQTNHRLLRYDLINLPNTTPSTATQGTSYTQTLTENSQGTTTLALTSGALPSGLSLSSSGLSGTPTESGTFSFSVQATDDNGTIGSFVSNTRSYTLTVSAGGGVVPIEFLQAQNPTSSPSPTPSTTDPNTLTGPNPTIYNLSPGDIIRSEASPNVYVINEWGFKRYLAQTIQELYGHLKDKVATIVSSETLSAFPEATYIRNCEADDQKVYTIKGDTKHHIQLSGAEAASQDPAFFLKVFCVNSGEDTYYQPGVALEGVE